MKQAFILTPLLIILLQITVYAKTDTIYIEKQNTQKTSQISIDEKTYTCAIETAKSTIDNLKWLIGIILTLAGVIISGLIVWNNISTKKMTTSLEGKLKDAEDKINKNKIIVEDLHKNICASIKQAEEIFPKLENNLKEYNDVDNKIKNSVKDGLKQIQYYVDEIKNTAMVATETANKADENAAEAIKLSKAATHLFSGDKKIKENNYKGALEEYHKALEIKNNFPEPYIGCGLTHTLLQEYNKALEYFNKALDVSKTNDDKSNALGWIALVYAHLGNEIAVEFINKAMSLTPNWFQYNLACAYSILYKTIGNNNYKENAFDFLKQSLINNEISKDHVLKDDDWVHLKDDTLFKEFINKF